MTHEPVLLDRIIEFMQSAGFADRADKKLRIADCTLGLGGYSEKFLQTFADAEIYGLDRDLRAIEISENRLSGYASRFKALHGNFGGIGKTIKAEKKEEKEEKEKKSKKEKKEKPENVEYNNAEYKLDSFAPFDALVFDLGVSNMQLTEAERGFSFQTDGPLDMRMDSHSGRRTAADVVNTFSAAELAEIFWVYGEERFSRQIAGGIEAHRKRGQILRTTGELVDLIRSVLPAPVQRKMGTHPARRVFQALRIYVNDEIGELESALASVKGLAAPGAMVAIVSYHSLEDRVVKHTFRAWEKEKKWGSVLTKRPIFPETEEIGRNHKARSAKLRFFRFF